MAKPHPSHEGFMYVVSNEAESELVAETTIAAIREVEAPLLDALRTSFAGDKATSGQDREQWLVCGPGNIALTRILQHRLGIAIKPWERIEEGVPSLSLRLCIYSPDYPTSARGLQDHVYTTLYPGWGTSAYYIDPTYRLHWQQHGSYRNATRIRPVVVSLLDKQLAEGYSLYPWRDHPELWPETQLFSPPAPTEKTFVEWERALHTNRATMRNYAIGRYALGAWADKTVQAIQAVEPGWRRPAEAYASPKTTSP
jgi:hypothetical protein